MVDLEAARGLLEALPDGVVLVDRTGQMTYVSQPLARMTGYEATELVGAPVEQLVPERQRERHVSQRDQYQEAPQARTMGTSLDIHVLRKDGSRFPADIALKPVQTKHGPGVMAVVRDASERRAQEKLLRDTQARTATVEDRERIGRELHDGTIQALFGIGMKLQAAAAGADAEARQRMEETVEALDDVIRDLRNYVFGLRPGVLSKKTLAQAIVELASRVESDSAVVVVVDVTDEAAENLAGREATVLQVVREGLSNVARHAAATTCRVSLRSDKTSLVLEIDDDGHGFDRTTAASHGHGLGNLEERAAELGGELSISSGSEGTTVRLSIPVMAA
jgi:PAS domain S-box-containing protein